MTRGREGKGEKGKGGEGKGGGAPPKVSSFPPYWGRVEYTPIVYVMCRFWSSRRDGELLNSVPPEQH